MSVIGYQKNSQNFFRARVQILSKKFPEIRFSEQVSGLRSEAEARKAEARISKDIQRKISEAEIKRSISGQTLGYVLDAWYHDQREVRLKFGDIKEYVLEDYYRGMKKCTAGLQNKPCSEIRPIDLMQLFNDLTDQGVSFTHRRKMRSTIKNVFDYGIQSGLVTAGRNPMSSVILRKPNEVKPEILNIEEIRTLLKLAYAQKHDWRFAWAMALLTGMRNGELFALKWTDVDWDQKLITVSRSFNCRTRTIGTTKAGYWRDVPIGDEGVRLLIELRELTGKEEFILPRLPRWDHGIQAAVLRTFCLECRLPSIRFHTLRACFGTQLLRQGIPAAVVMKIAGWKDLKTMQRYIRLAGVEVVGATDKLSVLPPEAVLGNVIAFRNR